MNPPTHPSPSPATKANAPTAALLRNSLEAMAQSCSVPVTIWNDHANTVLDAAGEIHLATAVVEAAERATKAHYDWWRGETSKPNFHEAMLALVQSLAAYRARVTAKETT